mmetsp:Transcript_40724/g.115263  ORF Transcript_40724/g.115263 Transcript_40724/m.115263 type:complete len:265 (+) Transcript_40724:2190-2984(+)
MAELRLSPARRVTHRGGVTSAPPCEASRGARRPRRGPNPRGLCRRGVGLRHHKVLGARPEEGAAVRLPALDERAEAEAPRTPRGGPVRELVVVVPHRRVRVHRRPAAAQRRGPELLVRSRRQYPLADLVLTAAILDGVDEQAQVFGAPLQHVDADPEDLAGHVRRGRRRHGVVAGPRGRRHHVHALGAARRQHAALVQCGPSPRRIVGARQSAQADGVNARVVFAGAVRCDQDAMLCAARQEEHASHATFIHIRESHCGVPGSN